MLDDVLHDNPLFNLFLSSHHYAVAAAHSLTVVVPPASSLPSALPARLAQSLLDSHVLRVSPYFVGQYLTANGRNVSLLDGRSLQCVAGGGWSREEEGRVSRVVASETYYDEQLASFTVLRVDLPLEGRVSADYERSVRSEGAGGGVTQLLPRRSLGEHEAALQRWTGDGATLQSVQRFVAQFNSSYVLVRGFLDHAGQKVADACTRLTAEASGRATQRLKDGSSRRFMAVEVSAAVECAVMSGVHSALFGGLVELHAAEERRMQAAIARMSRLSMEALGIREDIRCQPLAACQLLEALGTLSTPLQKMAQLEEVNRAITQAVREQTPPQRAHRSSDEHKDEQHAAVESGSGSAASAIDQSGASVSVNSASHADSPRQRDLVLSAEDVIPLTVYVLTHSRLQHVTAHMAHLQHFPPSPASECVDQLAVHWVNLQAACQYVQAVKLSALEQLEEEGKEEQTGPPMHALPFALSNSLLGLSTDGVDGASLASSSVRVARRPIRHSRSASSSTVSSHLLSARRSPSSSPTPPLSRPSSLPVAGDKLTAATRPMESSRPASSATAVTASASVPHSPANGARVQRRHATLPTQQRRAHSPAAATQPSLPPPVAQPQPHQARPSLAQPRSLHASTALNSFTFSSPSLSHEDDRLGDFLSRLKRSDDAIITGNLAVSR